MTWKDSSKKKGKEEGEKRWWWWLFPSLFTKDQIRSVGEERCEDEKCKENNKIIYVVKIFKKEKKGRKRDDESSSKYI
jgi:hypothetical protein